MKKWIAGWALSMGLVTSSMAADVPPDLLKHLRYAIPQAEPDRVEATPFPGIYEVLYGSELYYVSQDGRYLFRGQLVDLEKGMNLTEERLSAVRAELLAALDLTDMIIYTPKDKKHSVTIFTDIDCPYCRKLHDEMPILLQRGIEVRYLPFPRTPAGTPSYQRSVSVWCAEDRNQALDEAKAGAEPAERNCNHPIRFSLETAAKFGVNATPTLILSDGTVLPGYVPAEKLADALDRVAEKN